MFAQASRLVTADIIAEASISQRDGLADATKS